MIRRLVFLYTPGFARTVVYMLQASEYNVQAYLKWLWRVNDFRKVMYRRQLVMTRPAKLLLILVLTGMLLQMVLAIAWLISLFGDSPSWHLTAALALFVSTPLVWMLLAVLPLWLGRWLAIRPLTAVEVRRSSKTFAGHPATTIAVAGSYGKTTVKEILLAVLSEGKKVAATPANRNVARSHAQFAKALAGDEDVLVVEFGEGAPGDVGRFAKTIRPDIGIITGLAPAHLDKYKTLAAAGADIFSLAGYVGAKNLYVNADSQAAGEFIKSAYLKYGSAGAAGWKVSNIKSGFNGLSFTLSRGQTKLQLSSRLIGRHLVGPLALAAALAKKLGLSNAQIEQGIKKIQPFEHRMQPRDFHGAQLIDDTYNGNIDGMKAGLELLKELKAKRKIYITPGLVDQGTESAAIHQELGRAIAAAKPDVVVLMEHSVTGDIVKGLETAKYKGQLIREDDPLNFYTSLESFVAAGDLVLMQNDWPDNYY